jgi:hypothetical protein
MFWKHAAGELELRPERAYRPRPQFTPKRSGSDSPISHRHQYPELVRGHFSDYTVMTVS